MITRHRIRHARLKDAFEWEEPIPERDETDRGRDWEALEDTRIARVRTRIARLQAAADGTGATATLAEAALEQERPKLRRLSQAAGIRLGWSWSVEEQRWHPPAE